MWLLLSMLMILICVELVFVCTTPQLNTVFVRFVHSPILLPTNRELQEDEEEKASNSMKIGSNLCAEYRKIYSNLSELNLPFSVFLHCEASETLIVNACEYVRPPWSLLKIVVFRY